MDTISTLVSRTRSIFKMIIVEGDRAVVSLNTKTIALSSNFLLLLFFIDFGQW